MRSRRIALLLVLVCSMERTARAADAEDPKAKASQLVKSGNELYEKREYEAALGLFERAVAVYPSPMIYYNIGRTHQVLGNLVRAATYYEKFLAESGVRPGSERHQLAVAGLAEVDRQTGKLIIRGAPSGAVIELDGVAIEDEAPGGAAYAVAVAREPVRVAAGEHEVVARLEGHLPFRTSVRVDAGSTATVDIRLVAAPAVKEVALAPSTAAAVGPPIAAADADVDDSSIAGKWWFWTLIAAGAAIGVGVTVAATSGGGFSRPGELDTSSTKDWEPL